MVDSFSEFREDSLGVTSDNKYFVLYRIVYSPLRGHAFDSENEILAPPRIRTIYSLRQPVFRGQT